MYNIYINKELVGSGLSHGELNQWILDLDSELTEPEKKSFRDDLGFIEGDFEEYLYETKLDIPVSLPFQKDTLDITESEF